MIPTTKSRKEILKCYTLPLNNGITCDFRVVFFTFSNFPKTFTMTTYYFAIYKNARNVHL